MDFLIRSKVLSYQKSISMGKCKSLLSKKEEIRFDQSILSAEISRAKVVEAGPSRYIIQIYKKIRHTLIILSINIHNMNLLDIIYKLDLHSVSSRVRLQRPPAYNEVSLFYFVFYSIYKRTHWISW